MQYSAASDSVDTEGISFTTEFIDVGLYQLLGVQVTVIDSLAS